MKIAVIGSGSTYTPELAEGLITHFHEIGLKTLALMDIDRERLEIVGRLIERMVAKAGNPFEVVLTTSMQEAVSNAAFVLSQIRVGGQKARHDDTLNLSGRRHYRSGNDGAGRLCQSTPYNPRNA